MERLHQGEVMEGGIGWLTPSIGSD